MIEINNKNIFEILKEVASKFNNAAQKTIISENSGKHLFEITIILRNFKKKGAILDVGGGMGINLLCINKLLDKNAKFFLIDKFEEYTEENRMGSAETGLKLMQEENIDFISQDIWRESKLPFQEDTFDLVTIFDVTEHLPGSPLEIFKEIIRVLKPGGKIIFGGPNSVSVSKRIRLLFGKNPYISLKSWLSKNYYSHYREYNKSDNIFILKNVGFENIKTYMLPEPTRTQARHCYFNERKINNPLKITVLYIYYILELIFKPFRSSIYCVAQKNKG